MTHGYLQIKGGKGGNKGSCSVTVHQDQIGFFLEQDLLQAGQGPACDIKRFCPCRIIFKS